MITLKFYRANHTRFILCLLFYAITFGTSLAQNVCYNMPKELSPKVEAMLKGTSNGFYTDRSTHDFVASQTQKLPAGGEEKAALLQEKFFKYLEDTEADLNTLRNTFRTKGILPNNLRIAGAIASERQIIKSNRPKGPFAVPLPKEEQIHLEVTSTLFVVDNNAGIYSKRMLINAYILENNGRFSLLKIDSNPVSDLGKWEGLMKNLRVNMPELLSYTFLSNEQFRNIHYPGKPETRVQVNGEGSTTVMTISEEKVSSVFASGTDVKIKIADNIERKALPKALNEMQGILSFFGDGQGYNMGVLTAKLNRDQPIKVTYDFISQGAYSKVGNDIVKTFRVCYKRDVSSASLLARLVVSPESNGTYRMDLIMGKLGN